MPPFMGLASWAAFTRGMDQTMVMGDTVLFQDEVNPVMSVALDNGLSVTALHNHFFFDEPKVYFMHIGGTGSDANLAAAVKKVWDKIKEIRAANFSSACLRSVMSAITPRKPVMTPALSKNAVVESVTGKRLPSLRIIVHSFSSTCPTLAPIEWQMLKR